MAAIDFLTSMVSVTIMRSFLNIKNIQSLMILNSKLSQHFLAHPYQMNQTKHSHYYYHSNYVQDISERFVKVKDMLYDVQSTYPSSLQKLPLLCSKLCIDIRIVDRLTKVQKRINSLSWIFDQLMEDDCGIIHLTIKTHGFTHNNYKTYNPHKRLPRLESLFVINYDTYLLDDEFLIHILPYFSFSQSLKRFFWYSNSESMNLLLLKQLPPPALTNLDLIMVEESFPVCLPWIEALQHQLVRLRVKMGNPHSIPFSSMGSLQDLNLSSSRMLSIAVLSQCNFPNLKVLNLSSCSLTNYLTIPFFECNNYPLLQLFLLNDNKLNDQFINYLCKKKISSSLHIHLNDNSFLTNASLQIYRDYLMFYAHKSNVLLIDFSNNSQLTKILLFEILNLLAKHFRKNDSGR